MGGCGGGREYDILGAEQSNLWWTGAMTRLIRSTRHSLYQLVEMVLKLCMVAYVTGKNRQKG
jgi:hypothetical protein